MADDAGRAWADVAPRTPQSAGWGQFKVGVGDPDTALGRLVLGQIVQSVAQAEKLPADPGVGDFDRLIDTLRRPGASAPQSDSDDELAKLSTQPGSFSLVAATAPAASRLVASERARQQGLQVVSLEPAGRADAVVAPLVGGDIASRIVDLFTGQTGGHALDNGGWAPGKPAGSNGMPAADVLAALRDRIG